MMLEFVLLLQLTDFLRTGSSDCLDDLRSTPYSGDVSVTNNGQICQAWSAQSPHQHTIYPDGSLEEASNYCRDVYDPGRPWCYTMDPDITWGYCTFSICQGLSTECGGILENQTGSVTTPDSNGDGFHDPHLDCMWRVAAEDGEIIKFSFQFFGRACSDDLLMIWERNTTSYWFCQETGILLTGETVTDVLVVQLYSEESQHSPGFMLTFQRLKTPDKDCDELLLSSSGWIGTPDLDGDGLYDHNLNCRWLVDVEDGHIIEFQLLYAYIRPAEKCNQDSLEILDEAGYIIRYCGYLPKQAPVTTVADEMYVLFNSDGIGSGMGFNSTYIAILDTSLETKDCLDDLLSSTYNGSVSVTNSGRTCQKWSSQVPHRHTQNRDSLFPLDGSVEEANNYCRDVGNKKGRPWCYTKDRHVEWEFCTFSICNDTVFQECGGLVESQVGFITPPAINSANYININADCLWIITAPRDHVIKYQIVFLEFDLDGDCTNYSSLVLFEKDSPFDQKLFCDFRLNGHRGETKSNVAYIHFYADHNLNHADFNISFQHGEVTKSDCKTTLTGNGGWIASPDADGDGFYDFNLKCRWVVSVDHEMIVSIQYEYIDISLIELDETGYCVGDYLEISDGYGALATYCGLFNSTPDLDSRTNIVYISFFSDSFSTAAGFNLTYKAIARNLNCLDSLLLSLYSGTVSVTNHGHTCQPWASHTPHRHFFEDDDFVVDGGAKEAKNYCRNFEGVAIPFCYTTDPNIVKEFCTHSICSGETTGNEMLLRNQSGWIKPPDYDGDGLYDVNVDFLWKLEAAEDFRIVFQISDIEIEHSDSCSKDSLTIFEKKAWTTICATIEEIITGESLSNALYVQFYSDSSVHYSGFNFSFFHIEATDKECAVALQGTSGWISSPDQDGDGHYDHNVECFWVVKVEEGMYISCQVLFIDIEISDVCDMDYLWISSESETLLHICGQGGAQPVIETRSNIMFVLFSSNSVKSGAGFNLTYHQIEGHSNCYIGLEAAPYSGRVSVTNNGQKCQAWSAQIPHEHSENTDDLFPMDGSVSQAKNYCRDIYRNGRPWCYTMDPDISWGYCTLAICEETVNECGGVLECASCRLANLDMDADGSYDPNVDCLWKIIVMEHHVIRFRLERVEIEWSEGCKKDALWIYEGRSASDWINFCGNLDNLPQEGETSANVLYVQFISDHQNFYDGGYYLRYFQIKETNKSCIETLRGESGWVAAPDIDGDGWYDFNVDCTWVIEVDPDHSILFQVNYVQTELADNCEKDYVQVFEIAPPQSGLYARFSGGKISLGSYCGTHSSLPSLVTWSSNLYVEFSANNFATYLGFNLTYDQVQRQKCGGTLKQTSGWISAPDKNADGLYDLHIYCHWIIIVDSGKGVEIEVMNNYICGEHGRQAPYQIVSNEVDVVFLSDYRGNDIGFLLFYKQIEVFNTFYTIDRSEEIFEFPGYLASYDKDGDGLYDYNARWSWIFLAETNKIVLLQVLYADIEEGCLNDFLMIATSQGYLTLCGTFLKTALSSGHNFLAVVFTSDGSINGVGFAVAYSQLDGQSSECDSILTSPSEYIGSVQTDEGSYSQARKCTWTIHLARSKVIILQVLEIASKTTPECDTGFLEVYEEHLQIGKFCGSTPPPISTSESNVLYVTDSPDHFIDSVRGFKAVYFEAEDPKNCSNDYRCLSADISIPRHYLCDKYKDCPNGDDERFCHFRCPPSCACFGLLVDCSGKTLPCDYEPEITAHGNQSIELSSAIRSLDISTRVKLFRTLKFEQQNLPYIRHLNISFCEIFNFSQGFFFSMLKLKELDISYNKIKRLTSGMFSYQSELENLYLEGNAELLVFETECFSGLSSLRYLNLTDLHIETISENAFAPLHLTGISIYRSVINKVETDFLRNMRAEYIYLNTSKLNTFARYMFEGAKDVRLFVTDDYKFCCVRPSSVSEENCFPRQDEFSSCDDLVKSELLRPLIWLSGLFILLGNPASILYRFIYQGEQFKHCFGILVSNLALSDFLMGIYLIIIASADTILRGKYIFYDQTWKESTWCKLAGILSTWSYEASLLFICLITLDRFLVIKYPFGQRRLTLRNGTITTVIVWIIALILAVIPEAFNSIFQGLFYSQSDVCLALPITRARPPGWGYAFGIFIVLNSVLCILVALGQWSIYTKIKESAKALAGSRSRNTNDARIAWNLLLVATTNFLCCFPICILGGLTLSDYVVHVDVYSWIAVVVLPINSAVNPILYTLSAILQKKASAKSQNELKKPDVMTTDHLDSCLDITRNPAYRKFPDNPSDYDKFRHVLLRGRLGIHSRLLIAVIITKLLHQIHDKKLKQDLFTIDDIYIKRTETKPHIKVALLCRLGKAIRQADYADNIYALGSVLTKMVADTKFKI